VSVLRAVEPNWVCVFNCYLEYTGLNEGELVSIADSILYLAMRMEVLAAIRRRDEARKYWVCYGACAAGCVKITLCNAVVVWVEIEFHDVAHCSCYRIWVEGESILAHVYPLGQSYN
jgi:hypothetical protein